jgi:hypothetical protein
VYGGGGVALIGNFALCNAFLLIRVIAIHHSLLLPCEWLRLTHRVPLARAHSLSFQAKVALCTLWDLALEPAGASHQVVTTGERALVATALAVELALMATTTLCRPSRGCDAITHGRVFFGTLINTLPL